MEHRPPFYINWFKFFERSSRSYFNYLRNYLRTSPILQLPQIFNSKSISFLLKLNSTRIFNKLIAREKGKNKKAYTCLNARYYSILEDGQSFHGSGSKDNPWQIREIQVLISAGLIIWSRTIIVSLSLSLSVSLCTRIDRLESRNTSPRSRDRPRLSSSSSTGGNRYRARAKKSIPGFLETERLVVEELRLRHRGRSANVISLSP